MRSRIAATATVLVVLAAASGGLARSMDAQASATKEGIDVSSFQGTIAWHSVAAAGISFAYIRAADGDGGGDQQFATNWRGATGAGVTPGAYLFFEPSESPTFTGTFFCPSFWLLSGSATLAFFWLSYITAFSGTVSTPLCSSSRISAFAVMFAFNSPPGLSIETRTSNVVTLS